MTANLYKARVLFIPDDDMSKPCRWVGWVAAESVKQAKERAIEAADTDARRAIVRVDHWGHDTCEQFAELSAT